MKLKKRRILFSFSTIIFFVVSIILLAYASGWRYNFKIHRIEKVGAVLIETKPKGANITINNHKSKKKTPATINNLMSGKYHIKLQKDGYFKWTNETSVKSGMTTRLANIELLAKPRIMELVNGKIIFYSLSRDKKSLFFTKESETKILAWQSGKIQFSLAKNINPLSLSWSKDSLKIAYNKGDAPEALYIIDLQKKTNNNISLEYGLLNVKTFFWSPVDDSVLFINTKDGFYRLNLFQKVKTKLSPQNNFIYSDNKTYFAQDGKKLEIFGKDLSLTNNTSLRTDDPLSVLRPINGIYIFLDEKNENLYLYEPNTDTVKLFNDNIKGMDVLNEENTLIYNRHEIWRWNAKKLTKELILRTSKTINKAVWLSGHNYVAYLGADGNIKAIEFNLTYKNSYLLNTGQILDILTTKDLQILSINSNGINLYSFK